MQQGRHKRKQRRPELKIKLKLGPSIYYIYFHLFSNKRIRNHTDAFLHAEKESVFGTSGPNI